MHLGGMSRTRTNSFFPVWVRQRELMQRKPLGHADSLYKSLYSSFSPCHLWSGGETSTSGALLSLDFSPDGTLLVAGCEKNSFLMFDPLSRRLIRTVHNAHTDVVTNIKFLDSRIFATGSADRIVSLWDTRNLKTRCERLVGHSSVVDNIEFSRKNDLLISSEIDGIICIWDMKNWNKRRELNKDTLYSNIFLRLRLSPDETKMIISTTKSCLLVVHNLDLNTIAQDLSEFVLDMFVDSYLFEAATGVGRSGVVTPDRDYSRFLFPNPRRNRVEIVADFPITDGMISALEIHPQGWSAFSRCVSENSEQEWTCVHDIQEREPSECGAAPREESGDEGPPGPQQGNTGRAKRHRLEWISEERCSAKGKGVDTGNLGTESVGLCKPSCNDASPELSDAAVALERGARKRRCVSLGDSEWMMNPPPRPSSAPPHPPELAGRGINPTTSRMVDRRVHKLFPRLTHYIEEPIFSDWNIESLSVSADGRLVCSPVERGIRLLALSPECSEQSVSSCGTKPRLLYEFSTHTYHSDIVICTKFSPRHCLLVSGYLDGKLAWYQPVV